MRVALFCLISLAGCAQISGLDSLGVGDGASPVDATSEEDVATTTDANAMADHDANASDASDATPPLTDGATGPCVSPADCKGGDVCCETMDTSGSGQPPSCTIDADTVACASATACPTAISFTCADKDVFRRCANSTDCTEANYNKCCKATLGEAGTRTVCLSSQIASLIGASCP